MATYYLKYRPQTIADLDLDSVRFQLTKVLEAKSIPHAFLFSGPRGLGKTSSARILAKAINCENRKPGTVEPCNQCDVCLSITKGNAIDVIEIDGASNRGIDDVRTLREGVASAPLRLKKKIYVIDEVHMLTKEAFNALLKTLEEPPEHVIFILATTEPQKVPETILSRSFHLQFHRASDEELKRSLERVIKGEGLEITPGAMEKVIAKAEGGFRDCTKLLEQLSMVGKTIDESVVSQVFSEVDGVAFIRFLHEKECRAAISWIQKSQEVGVDWEDVLRMILLNLREALLSHFGMPSSRFTFLTLEETRQLIPLMLECGAQLKTSPIPTLPLELAVARWCDDTPSSKTLPDFQPSQTQKPAVIAGKTEERLSQPKSEKADIPKPAQVTELQNMQLQADNEARRTSAQAVLLPLEQVKNDWPRVLTKIKTANNSVEALLHSTNLTAVEGDIVVITVYYEFHKGQLEKEKCLQLVEQALTEVFGLKLRLKYILGEKREKEKLDTKKDEDFAKMAEDIFT